ncbi:sugar-phosphatase [Lysinibacillus piscis]|uniref:Phosphatase YxeH n=1 Tax=Lysinibacillus piscis TaxID=2518931 RepID=A0ABQ5NP16_9BACI|nr:sugar-phosphatase [Lysinibacillus sp. KH24]GLC90047.1 putative phosphatase YxeH [Lysinibacillus sp. KH24]
MYKLLTIDMDGTLLNNNHEVTAEVREALQEARAKGVKVVLCTGRPLAGVQSYIKELQLNGEEDFVIVNNGAIVQSTYTNEILFKQFLNYQDLMLIHQTSYELQTPLHFFDENCLYTTNKLISPYTVHEVYLTKIPFRYTTFDEVSRDIEMPKAMFIDEPAKLDATIERMPAIMKEKYALVKSAPFYLEILHKEVSKGTAVQKLAEKLGIAREEIMAMGDNENDLSMIQYAGCGVAMGNAIESVKAVADYVTISNNEHGVAHAIRELILK